MTTIPFNKPSLVGNELQYVKQAVESGVISGEGLFSRRAEGLIEGILGGSSRVLLTPSCTDALEMCALLLNLGPGDEVIMPSFTFVSTATAFALRGARPVFGDVDPETLNLTADEVERCLSPRTKAIVVVHYGGVGCEERIYEIGEREGIAIVEDAAHAMGGFQRGRALGTLGSLATFSFHETKNVTCGEGGALVVNVPSLVERAHIIRDKGTNRKRFQRGDVAFYTWVDIGSSFVISDVLAAFLFGQLEHLGKINRKRRASHALYSELLAPLRDAGHLRFPNVERAEDSTAHLFFLLVESPDVRSKLAEALQKKGIYAVSHYQPLHLSPYAVAQWGKQCPLPVTESASACLLRLPMYYSLSQDDQERIGEAITEFFA